MGVYVVYDVLAYVAIAALLGFAVWMAVIWFLTSGAAATQGKPRRYVDPSRFRRRAWWE